MKRYIILLLEKYNIENYKKKGLKRVKDFEEIVKELPEDNFLKEILKAKPAIDLPSKDDIANRFDDEDYDIMLAEYLM